MVKWYWFVFLICGESWDLEFTIAKRPPLKKKLKIRGWLTIVVLTLYIKLMFGKMQLGSFFAKPNRAVEFTCSKWWTSTCWTTEASWDLGPRALRVSEVLGNDAGWWFQINPLENSYMESWNIAILNRRIYLVTVCQMVQVSFCHFFSWSHQSGYIGEITWSLYSDLRVDRWNRFVMNTFPATP